MVGIQATGDTTSTASKFGATQRPRKGMFRTVGQLHKVCGGGGGCSYTRCVGVGVGVWCVVCGWVCVGGWCLGGWCVGVWVCGCVCGVCGGCGHWRKDERYNKFQKGVRKIEMIKIEEFR